MKAKLKIIFLLILFLGIFGLAKSSEAASSYNASTCSDINVQTAINSCVNDSGCSTVNVPAGSCSWTRTVTITKGITLQGSGQTSTVLTPNNTNMFKVTGDGGTFRLTNMGFNGGSVPSFIIGTGGNFTYVRVDHITSIGVSGPKWAWSGYDYSYGWSNTWKVKMLFDHITYTAPGSMQFLFAWGRYQVWNEPDDYGTDNAIFIEDSTFNYTGSGLAYALTDTEYGGRLVIRNNNMNHVNIYTHDAHTGLRGQRLLEIYNNILSCTAGSGDCSSQTALGLRGGTGVFYNNTVTGNQYAAWSDENSRSFMPSYAGVSDPLLICGGQAKICSDTQNGITFHCSLSPHQNCGYPSDFGDWGTCKGSGNSCVLNCSIDSDCATGQKCIYIDGNRDSTGWPCRDQNGTGQDNPVTHQNTLDPWYVWNNTWNGSTILATTYGLSQLQENRDFCNHSPATICGLKPAWTYTPYTYPHPLQSGGSSDTTPPACPVNLVVQ